MNGGTPETRPRISPVAGEFAGPPPGPRPSLAAEILLPLALAALLTGWARAAGFDLAAQRWIYRIGGDSWSLGDHPFWQGLYYGGTIPAAVAVFGALLAFASSWSRALLRPWRRVFAFVILAGVIGPGVITNAVLKEYWGRPRPRELVPFGGQSEFEPVFTYHPASEGLSFPCGHATMGFFFLAAYFLLRRHRPFWAGVAVFASLAFGGLLGIARMTQGGHFFTDVVWAAVVCWFTPLALFRVLGLHRRLLVESDAAVKPMPWPWKAGFSALGLVLLAAVLLATPYEEKRSFAPINGFVKEGPLSVRLMLAVEEVEIVSGDEFRIEAEGSGHGIPTSKIGRFYEETDLPEGGHVLYAERISGWFREVRSRVRITLPWQRMRLLKLDTGDARVTLRLGKGAARPAVQLLSGTGRVTLFPDGQRLRWIPSSDPRVVPGPVDKPDPGASLYRIELGRDFAGVVDVASP